MTAPRDRWHQLAAAIRDSNLTPADKHVFGYLLSAADFRTAELPARFTPTRKTIARKTSLSYSQVGYSTRHLERHGWLTAKGATGPGHPLEYGFALGRDCDCTGRVHAPRTVPTDTATLPTGRGDAASGWHRTLPTDTANAAGQTPNHTERAERRVVGGTVERGCSVPGCGEPARLYPGGWRCEAHRPRPFSAETGTMRRAAP